MDSQVAGPSHVHDQQSPGLHSMRNARASTNISGDMNAMDTRDTEMADMSILCRICASTHEHLIPMFEGEGLENKLVDKIHSHLPIKVDNTDALPDHVCYQCASTLLAWHDLVQCCIQSNISLLERANRIKIHETAQTPVQEKSVENGSENTRGRSARLRLLSDDSRRRQKCSFSPVSETLQTQVPPTECSPAVVVDNTDKTNGNAPDVGETCQQDFVYGRKLNMIRNISQNLAFPLNKVPENFFKDLYKVVLRFKEHCEIFHTGDSSSVKKHSETDDIEDDACHVSVGSDGDPREDVSLDDIVEQDDKTDLNVRGEGLVRQRPSAYGDEATEALEKAKRKIDNHYFYECPECGKNLRTAPNFVHHLRIHSGERPCVCHLCGKQFRIESGLHRHLKETHQKIKTHSCETCGSKFANAQNLAQHIRIHTGERPYVCSKCGKRFKQSGSLYIHNKTHTDHYPHACTTCDAKFRSRTELTHHIFKHTGEKPNVCEVCGRAFRMKNDLNRHKLVHTGEKPFSCSDCGISFRQRRYLRNHLKKNHSNAPAI